MNALSDTPVSTKTWNHTYKVLHVSHTLSPVMFKTGPSVDSLIMWTSRILTLTNSIESLTSLQYTQLVKKLPTSCGTQRFITVLTRACHQSASWAAWIQSASPNPISLEYLLISSFCLCLSTVSSLQDLQSNLCTHFLFPRVCYMPHQPQSP